MTPEQVVLVQESFNIVRPIASQAADLFYDRLFEIAPEVRTLFPENMQGQKTMLMSMLATAVDNLHQMDAVIPAVQDLGRRHVGYGVTVEHYRPVGEALIWTLQQGLGSAFTAEVQDAWVATYGALMGVMTGAAADMSGGQAPA